MRISTECPDTLLISVDFLDSRFSLCLWSRLFSLTGLFNFINVGFCLFFDLRRCLRLCRFVNDVRLKNKSQGKEFSQTLMQPEGGAKPRVEAA